MQHQLNPFTNPNLFMWIITGLYAAQAINCVLFTATNWKLVAYCVGAIILQVAVLSMNTKS